MSKLFLHQAMFCLIPYLIDDGVHGILWYSGGFRGVPGDFRGFRGSFRQFCRGIRSIPIRRFRVSGVSGGRGRGYGDTFALYVDVPVSMQGARRRLCMTCSDVSCNSKASFRYHALSQSLSSQYMVFTWIDKHCDQTVADSLP